MTAQPRVLTLLGACLVLAMAAVTLAMLPDPIRGYVFVLPWQQYGDALPQTLLAALRVWGFWSIFAGILGAILLRLDATMERSDAILGGYLGVWVIAFIAGNLLGPLGMMNRWTVWGLLVLSALVLARLGAPDLRWRPLSPGQWLAVLSLAIVGPGLLAIQLGHPVAPFMDVLATPASAQRVLTFGTYQPLDSDPYGYWDAGSQCPAAELLYAFLTIGSGVPYAVLGQTAAIVPMAALLILAVYRLGCAVGDDRVGGFAALLLVATILFRVLPYSHGRTITHVLVAAGLAWFVDPRGSATRRALAGLTLGTAVGSHAVVGALGMGVAALTVVFSAFDLGFKRVAAAVGLLAGASLVAAPEVVVGIRLAIPYPALPLAQALGVLMVVACGHVLAGPAPHQRWISRLLRWSLALGLLWAWTRSPPLVGGLQNHWDRFPVLFYGGGLGLAVMLWLDRTRPSPVGLAPVAVAIALAAVAEKASAEWWQVFADPRVRIAVNGFYRKVDYWYPFVWVLPAGWLCAWISRWTSTGVATLVLLAVLFYPARVLEDPNYNQQSIAAVWAQQTALAKGGYWGSTGHRRWAQTPAEFEVARLLMEEVDAGRITFSTHVVHIEPYVVLYEDVVLFSIYTGINDDTYIVGDWEPDISNVGGRVWPRRELPAALAARPPYVVVHDRTRNARTLPEETRALLAAALPDYEELFADDGVRLLRRPPG